MEKHAALFQFIGEYHGSKLWQKMNESDHALVKVFIGMHEHESFSDFEMRVNRLFLDRSDKPKNIALIQEVLLCVNSKARKNAK